MQSPGAKPMKSSPFARRGRGAAGLKPSASGAASSASAGHSVEGEGAGRNYIKDYATIAQLKAVARALQPGGSGKQHSKLKASFIEQKKARGELLGAEGPAGRQGPTTDIHRLMAANAVQALEAGNMKAR